MRTHPKSPAKHVASGLWLIPFKHETLQVISTLDNGRAHVSVVVKGKKRTPTWEEMCFVKECFWEDEEEAIQIHPKKSEYVNYHNYCLHIVDKERP